MLFGHIELINHALVYIFTRNWAGSLEQPAAPCPSAAQQAAALPGSGPLSPPMVRECAALGAVVACSGFGWPHPRLRWSAWTWAGLVPLTLNFTTLLPSENDLGLTCSRISPRCGSLVAAHRATCGTLVAAWRSARARAGGMQSQSFPLFIYVVAAVLIFLGAVWATGPARSLCCSSLHIHFMLRPAVGCDS